MDDEFRLMLLGVAVVGLKKLVGSPEEDASSSEFKIFISLCILLLLLALFSWLLLWMKKV